MIECSVCTKTLSSRRSLRRHSSLVHKVQLPDLRPEGLVCASCLEKFSSTEIFSQHLHDAHDVIATIERRKFDSKHEFESWRRAIESSNPVKFVMNHSQKDKGKRVIYYHCNRSGPVRIRVNSDERKREIKAQGSRKINAYCPARITATFNEDDSVAVRYCLTHFGHKMSAVHVPLPSPAKKAIAGKIAAHVPFDCILSDVRNSLSGDLLICRSVDGEKKEEDSRQIVSLLSKPNLKSLADDKKDIIDTFTAAVEGCDTKVKIDIIRETLRTMNAKLAAAERVQLPEKFECTRIIDIRRKIEPQRQFKLKKKINKRQSVEPTNEEVIELAAQSCLQSDSFLFDNCDVGIE